MKPIGIKNRHGSLDNLNEELVALNKTNEDKAEKMRIIGTPTGAIIYSFESKLIIIIKYVTILQRSY